MANEDAKSRLAQDQSGEFIKNGTNIKIINSSKYIWLVSLLALGAGTY